MKYFLYFRFFLLCVYVLGSGLAFAESVGYLQNIQTFKLGNGLEVVHIPNTRAPVIMQAVCYRIGSADDPLGKSGVAHYLEHLMFRGTKNNKDGVFKRKVTEIGGVSNAFTDHDVTLYYQIFSKNHLEEMMALEADRMQHFEPSPAAFESEKKIVLEEYQMRTGNSKHQQLVDAVNTSFFAHHPYRIPVIGWWEELQQISREDALEFHKNHYGPGNAILCLAGDIDFEAVQKLAQKYYGSIPSRELVKRKRVPEPKHNEETLRVEMRHREAPNLMEFIYEAPNLRTGNRKEVLGLMIFETMLGQDSSGLLFKHVAQRENLAFHVNANYFSAFFDPFSFCIRVSPEAHYDVKAIEAIIPVVLRQLIQTDITEELVSKAKKSILLNHQEKMSELNDATISLLTDLANGLSLKDILEFGKELSLINKADVKLAVERYLSKPPRLISVGISLPNVEYGK